MLFSERKRIKLLEVREAKGDFIWTSHASQPLRTKVKRLINSYGWVVNQYDHGFGRKELTGLASRIIAHETGESEQDFEANLVYCADDDFPNVIEAAAISIMRYASEGIKEPDALESFHKGINALLDSYRMGYSLENCEIIEFESREMHKGIVSPMLRLVTAVGWEKVEKAYSDALKELSEDNPSDAITDATTSLQEALRKLGCKGDELGTLLKSARNTILKSYDSKYVDAIGNLISWTSAARSNRGDSHKVPDVSKDDAWFVVHTVGILILRLSKMSIASSSKAKTK